MKQLKPDFKTKAPEDWVNVETYRDYSTIGALTFLVERGPDSGHVYQFEDGNHRNLDIASFHSCQLGKEYTLMESLCGIGDKATGKFDQGGQPISMFFYSSVEKELVSSDIRIIATQDMNL
ncbi:MAG: hypothetical protein AAF587_45105 [Bacteroidota bacterium]